MAMVSFGHPVHRQAAKEKPLQTQKPNHRGIMSRPTMPPQLWDRVCHRELARESDHNP